ncbi:MAG TPA: hypothetical protein VJ485_04290 [archaeon]|nr:hypothetical protein [archaeon]
MVYGAILENESATWNKGMPFFVLFESVADYMRTVTQRQYLNTKMAPATEVDMDRIETEWLKSRKKNYDL